MFSVHQMHPETALRLALGATLGGLAKQQRSLQSMIQKYGTGIVVMGTSVEYLRELTFFSAPSISTDASVALRDDAKLITFQARHYVGDEEAIAVRIGLRPVHLTGGEAMDAVPAPAGREVRALFDADEVVPRSAMPSRRLDAGTQWAAAGTEKTGEDSRPLFIGRSDCEFAEQWFFARLPSIVASAREQLLFDGAAHLSALSALSASVARPLSTFQAEFFRPMFFGDRGTIETRCYQQGDRAVFVHRVLGAPIPGAHESTPPLCALAIETF
jgi:acyl-CoA thioesterase FadM